MADQTWQEWFENAWAVREETIYRSLFGEIGSGIYPLDSRTIYRPVSPNIR